MNADTHADTPSLTLSLFLQRWVYVKEGFMEDWIWWRDEENGVRGWMVKGLGYYTVVLARQNINEGRELKSLPYFSKKVVIIRYEKI